MSAPRSRCACGNIKSKWLSDCTQCASRKRIARISEACAIIEKGKCPTCGAGLRRNNSMAGWWQCEQLGADTHRKDASKPSCNFQTFTE